jgi:hypothetical protein
VKLAGVSGSIPDLGIKEGFDSIEVWCENREALEELKIWAERKGMDTSGVW